MKMSRRFSIVSVEFYFQGDDVYISDNAVDGSFIQCSLVNRVSFCNGLGGFVEFGGSPPENTNCYSAGVSNPSDGSCLI